MGDAGIAFDQVDNYTVLSDGLLDSSQYSNSPSKSTWTYSNGNWSDIGASPTYVQPAARWGLEVDMTYDAGDGYVLLFGGEDSNGSTLNDTWAFTGGNWTHLHPATAPSVRTFASMTYDAADGYVLLFGGGSGQYSGYYNDIWSFASGAWTNLTPGTTGAWPSERRGANLAYDALDGYVLLFGGQSSLSNLNDTWAYHGGTFTQLAPQSTPLPRFVGGMTYDARYHYVLLFGGCANLFGCAVQLNDTWAFRGGQWIELDQNFPSNPQPRGAPSVTWDARDGYVLSYGGAFNGFHTDQTLTYDWPLSVTLQGATVFAEAGAPLRINAQGHGGSLSYQYSFDSANASCPATNASTLSCTFSTPGAATISVLANDSTGAVANATLNVTVLPPVGATLAISHPVSEVGLTTTYWANATGGVPGYRYAYVGLPPGCSGTASAVVSCRLTSAGNFTATVTITDALGVASHASVDLVVLPALAASVPDLSVDAQVPFLEGPAISGGLPPYSIQWPTLPTGCVSGPTGTLRCTLPMPGFFGVGAVINDSLGATVPASALLTVAPFPTASLTPQATAALAPSTVQFTLILTGGTPAWNVSWDFGDGSPIAFGDVQPPHRFANPGTYVVRVDANDTAGAALTPTTSVVLVQPLAVTLNLSAPGNVTDAGLSVVFTAQAIDGYGSLSYTWQGLPPGCTAGSVSNVTCANLPAGSVSTSVRVTDGLGEIRSAGISLVVNHAIAGSPFATPQPVACGHLAVETLAANVTGGTRPLNASWQFGDNLLAPGLWVNHTYAAPGLYHAIVDVIDAVGGHARLLLDVNVTVADCPAPSTPASELTSPLALGGIALVLSVLVVVALVWRRRRPPASEEPPAPETFESGEEPETAPGG